MGDINITGTLKTPTISFNEKEKHLLIEGRSIPENPIEFYEPLVNQLKDYLKIPVGKIEIDFKLEYFNTSSSIVILEVLKQLKKISDQNNDVVVNWFYDEDDFDLLEVGEDYSALMNFPFNLLKN